jgi:hypothetical protein
MGGAVGVGMNVNLPTVSAPPPTIPPPVALPTQLSSPLPHLLCQTPLVTKILILAPTVRWMGAGEGGGQG